GRHFRRESLPDQSARAYRGVCKCLCQPSNGDLQSVEIIPRGGSRGMRAEIFPKVTLVGAGPGDPELITLKAVLALNKADVVLYDALIDPVLLDHAPENALKIFVGKRVGKHSHPQEDTNTLCVSLATKHVHVVRLNGCDPFVC